jgi:pimeloyl-ACP methyl ester carboxylesterase
MTHITTPDGITLEYETVGSRADPALLMVSGFGAQLVAWPRAFCERLAAGGRFVISYDNRDCGLSSKLDGPLVDMDAINAAASAGDFPQARSLTPYTLSDIWPTMGSGCWTRSESSEPMCSARRWAG